MRCAEPLRASSSKPAWGLQQGTVTSYPGPQCRGPGLVPRPDSHNEGTNACLLVLYLSQINKLKTLGLEFCVSVSNFIFQHFICIALYGSIVLQWVENLAITSPVL